MACFSEGFVALCWEVFVFFWCNTVRLLFWLRYYWSKPKSLPPVTNGLLLRSATRLAADIREGKVKSVDVVNAYIARIKVVQPVLNAVIEDSFDDALRKAEEADQLVASGSKTVQQLAREKPLLGVPFTTKNSVGVKDMRHDAGSAFNKGRRASQDAVVVANLRGAGAILVAMTNVPELLMWADSENRLDGATCNPYDTRRNPGGSSGGESSLISAAGSLMGIGTDIAGSIRVPSAFCGIFGHKPTAGIVSHDGIVPDVGGSMPKYNCVGPMCRYAEDLPLMLTVMGGDKVRELHLEREVLLRNLKVFFMDDEGSVLFSRVQWPARQAVRQVLEFLRNSHGIQPSRIEIPDLHYGLPQWMRAWNESKARPLHDLFRPGSASINHAAELIRLLTGTCTNTAAAILLSWMSTLPRFSSKEALTAFRGTLDYLRERLEALLGDEGVIILPATTGPAAYHHQDLFFPDGFSMTCVFNMLQMPVTVCPVLHTVGQGLPIAVQVAAKRGNDAICLAIAREIEGKFGGWVDPAKARNPRRR